MKNRPNQKNSNAKQAKPQYKNGNGMTSTQLILVFILISVVITAGTSYIMYLLFMNNMNLFSKKPTDELGPMYSLPEFVVNLNEPDRPKYVRIKVILEAQNKRTLKELQNRTPQIRDRVITTIRDKSAKDVENSEGLEALRGEIKSELNSIMGENKVVNVYFDGFVMQ